MNLYAIFRRDYGPTLQQTVAKSTEVGYDMPDEVCSYQYFHNDTRRGIGGDVVYTEKDLDRAFDAKLKSSPDFVVWFASKTKFQAAGATYLWSRSDNPWGRFEVTSTDPKTGEPVTVLRDSETDILLVLKLATSENVALHIENKPWNGRFQPNQAEQYHVRGEAWLRSPKYQNYVDYQTVLIAPREVFTRHADQASRFDVFVPYEEIATFVPEFAG